MSEVEALQWRREERPKRKVQSNDTVGNIVSDGRVPNRSSNQSASLGRGGMQDELMGSKINTEKLQQDMKDI